ncbi:2,3-dihydro-2,3-dihydroxybenzoate synthetase [Corynebacterium sp. 13CS0277]|uniref:isochorismatase family protein n=1 Tax=Corynebacterium sp. 13CS0277 TaxID=2071994 RepID=UPI000D045BAB|nr:isochorismatase family protein [Corynebacterium sp. 13CS0277]PRQ12378.1 2,3-dihydro-2,3-dihydroxybenzoate synthetase [Corynebacterium sp. 13CS0277]
MIPMIEHYPHPTVEDCVPGRATWDLDPSRAALLIHDMQRYFIAPFGDSALMERTIANIRTLLEVARAHGVPVFYTAQPPHQQPEDRGLLTDLWGTGLVDGEEIIAELAPQPGDTVLTKWRYDAFERSDFRAQLAAAGRDQLIIAGIYAHIGVLTTATSAFMKDIAPFLVADACADFSREMHELALNQAARMCAVVTDTARVVGALSR